VHQERRRRRAQLPDGRLAAEHARHGGAEQRHPAGTKTIDLFCCARVDPRVPVEDTIAELGRLVAEGRSAASRCPR
jgi:aryl-alcohol dehydrogenase-like predicted oxidoreductase